MKNKDCPYRYHCRSWAIDKCEGCNQNIVQRALNSNYGTGIYEKSNLDVNSVYPISTRLSGSILEPSAFQELMKIKEHEYAKMLAEGRSRKKTPEYPGIKNVKISGPCTIIFWEDGTKTVMRCSKIDENHFDAEKAILLAFYRKVTGFSKTHAQKELDKLTNEAYDNIFVESVKE